MRNKDLTAFLPFTVELLCVIASLFALPSAKAGVTTSTPFETSVLELPFHKGAHEFAFVEGAYISWTQNSFRRPSFNYQLTSLRVGWMLTDVHRTGMLRGNCELLLEAFGGPVFQGPGTEIAGGTLMTRYNFVQPHARIVPWAQIGVGGLYCDAYRRRDQMELGSGFEFNLQGSVGLSYFLSSRWAITGEAGYRHISNADTTSRNAGVNSVGGLAGLGYFF